MPANFCLTVRFLQPYSHGRGGGGEPEWPPSPLRLFQALVAAAAGRWNERTRLDYAVPALQWLELQEPPKIVAAAGVKSDVKYRLYVPDNVADKVAKSWSAGREASIADYRTEKDVRPTHLTGEAVHYLYPVAEGDAAFDAHRNTLADAARSITHVGWGVDMVAADATVLTDEAAAALPGERWRPSDGAAGDGLRVPVEGTLKDLGDKHAAFLGRLAPDGFKPVPPLTAYRVVGYARPGDAAGREWVAFRILAADPDDPKTPAFDTPRRCREVAAWVRHATGEVCAGWPFGDTAGFVHGHDAAGKQLKGDGADDRFMYLPLPTINHALRRVESIRRVLIAAPPRCADRVEWVRLRLPGHDLCTTGGEVVGMLGSLPASDWVLGRYVGKARVWSTVTPVVLPGHDDPDHLRHRLRTNTDADTQKRLLLRLERRADQLLRKALGQAGLPAELVGPAELEWRAVGFRPGVEPARRYLLPESSNPWPAYHVRVRFPDEVRGPLAVGACRYRGFGLFAAE